MIYYFSLSSPVALLIHLANGLSIININIPFKMSSLALHKTHCLDGRALSVFIYYLSYKRKASFAALMMVSSKTDQVFNNNYKIVYGFFYQKLSELTLKSGSIRIIIFHA